MTLDDLSAGAKTFGDFFSFTVVLGTIAQMLPSVAALLTVVWTGIRIYETSTVQRWLGRPIAPDTGASEG